MTISEIGTEQDQPPVSDPCFFICSMLLLMCGVGVLRNINKVRLNLLSNHPLGSS